MLSPVAYGTRSVAMIETFVAVQVLASHDTDLTPFFDPTATALTFQLWSQKAD